MNNGYHADLDILKTIYENTLVEKEQEVKLSLHHLVSFMDSFITCYREHKCISKHLEILKCKLISENKPSCDQEGCECEDDE